MKIVNKILLLCVIFTAFGCAAGKTAFDKAQQLERSGKYDEAVLKYAESISANPEMGEYRLRFLKASEQAAKGHLKAGDDYFANSRYEEAYNEYQKAVAMDASQDRAKQQSELVLKYRNSLHYYNEGLAFEKENKFKESIRSYQKALNNNQENKAAEKALEKLLKTKRTKTDGYELNLKSNKPITLKFKDAKLKDVFNIITQLSGINFVFDDGIKDANVTIFLENATFQQALDIISGMHKLSKKVLNETTVIIFPKTPDKIKQYEDLYVQTFFLNKLDAKKAVNLIRTMLQVKKIYVNEEMNTLVIRDTLDVIEVARRILDANDVPDAEVILEVEVIELAKNNAESFGMALSKYAVGLNTRGPSGQFFSDSFTTAQTTTPTTGAATVTTNVDTSQLLNLFRWGDYNSFITVPNATFNFGKTIGNAETLSNPKIRVKNREKAKFNVGTRVPITTTSSNGVGNYNVNVQYVDVGVKINAEPTIQLNNDVNIKLGLEVSSILSKEKVGSDGNTTVATIGTRNMDTVLSLKDGETSIIGGLIQDTKGQNSKKIFLLGDIPIIGQLFSSHDNTGDKTELILAITPRIVRGITVSDPEIASFWSGLEDDPSTSRTYSSFVLDPDFTTAPKAAEKNAPQLPGAAATTSVKQPAKPPAQKPAAVQEPMPASATAPLTPATPVAAPPGQGGLNEPVDSASATVRTQIPVQQTAPSAQAPAEPPPVQAKRVSLRVSLPSTVKQNDNFTADVTASDAENLFNAPLNVVFDPAVIECLSVSEGDFFRRDDKNAVFSSNIDNVNGKLTLNISRKSVSPAVSGAGKLFSAEFKAKAVGPASVGFIGVKLSAADGKKIDAILYNAVIEVKKP